MDVAVRSLHLIAAAVWAGGLVLLGVAAAVARRTVPEAELIEVSGIVSALILLQTLAILVIAADLVA